MELFSAPPVLFPLFFTFLTRKWQTFLTGQTLRRMAAYSNPMNGTWTTLDIAGKSADVYDLAAGIKPRFGILFLHGSGLETLRDRTAFTRLFDELRLVCVCPAGGLS